jgi:hypothetical protein
MKIIIESQSLEKQTEIDVHSFSLQVGNSRFSFVEGADGKLKIYGEHTVCIEPRGSNSFYVWGVR